jgi:adenine-specific DNA-methyltransferase
MYMAHTDFSDWSKEDLVKELKKLEERLEQNLGLVWNKEITKEKFDKDSENKLPILKEVKNKEIKTNKNSPTNILIEGDNHHSLSILNYTHKGKIDLIYIDPPYNTGKKDWKYNDSWITEEDTFRHSKWLSFMNTRLKNAKNLLKNDGLFLVHIDENEYHHLHTLLNQVFFQENYLGTIVWDKRNPKGDAKGISFQHEYLITFAKDRKKFTEKHVLERKKQHASIIIKKANLLFKSLGKSKLPAPLAFAIKKYNLPYDFSKFKEKEDLTSINQEFSSWINFQNFRAGEKMYKYIEYDGRVFRLVSMAWPNKKQAPKEYFKPLIHPKTKKACPVPARGWRNPPDTMNKLIKENRIVFGEDHTIQPQMKLFLDQNMTEKLASIYNFGGSDDKLFEDLDIPYLENPKPVSVVKTMLESFLSENGTVLDFFAGSGTTGHAVLELNKQDGQNRKFILCTNNENNIATGICYPRIEKIIQGYTNTKKEKVKGLGGNLKYFKTDFVDGEPTDKNKKKMVEQCTEMLCLKEDCFDEIKQTKTYSIFKNHEEKYLGIIYDDDGIEPLKKQIKSLNKKFNVYVFSLDDSAREEEFEDVTHMVNLKPIPEVILNVYRRILR